MESGAIPDRFTVLEEIAHTDSEILLRARDTVLEREVVLKLPGAGARKHILGKSRERTRVLREARALAKVQHPGVARLLDVIETAQGPLLVMQPLTGETLAARLDRDTRLEADEVRALAIALCDALAAVHAVGVVHRGVAAENIFLQPDGQPVLAGSVYAKPLDGVAMSSLNYRAGSADRQEAPALPAHPAPEQIAGQPADARSDLFGLGCVLYRCLTGRAAFDSDADGALPPEPRKVVEAPKDLSDAILKCLAHSPIARFQTAAALRDALAAPPTAARGGRRIVFAAVGAAAAVIVGALLLFRPTPDERGPVSDGGGPSGARASGGSEPKLAYGFTRSRALLIGVADYPRQSGHDPLRTPRSDIQALDQTLRAQGWEVRTLLDEQASHDAIKRALAEFENAQPDDRVLVYFAGHGETHPNTDQSGWILPHDAIDHASDSARRNWIRVDDFKPFMRETPAKHVMIALDCCYGGALSNLMRGRGAPTKKDDEPVRDYFAKNFVSKKARVVLTSGLVGQAVWDGEDHSPFAAEFLAALRDSDEGLLGQSLFDRIRTGFARRDIGHAPSFGADESTMPGADFVVRMPTR